MERGHHWGGSQDERHTHTYIYTHTLKTNRSKSLETHAYCDKCKDENTLETRIGTRKNSRGYDITFEMIRGVCKAERC